MQKFRDEVKNGICIGSSSEISKWIQTGLQTGESECDRSSTAPTREVIEYILHTPHQAILVFTGDSENGPARHRHSGGADPSSIHIAE